MSEEYWGGEPRICVIGLGYVGLPLALAFGKKFPTIGFDTSQSRIQELIEGTDRNNESSSQDIKSSKKLFFTCEEERLANSNVYIVTVPTPIDTKKRPDFGPLVAATELLGRHLKDRDIVIYESTVYPGATEEICVRILEDISQKTFNRDFFVGYSPERINPGDKEHKLTDVLKITSGSTEATAIFVDKLYSEIVDAGTHRASSIMVAEAAKVIENVQRDVNIALMNELSLIFERLGLNTRDVLAAANTKWNFLPFKPGLVGGHCIGVDPYYLTWKAKKLGYDPEVILAGRRINDEMARNVAHRVMKIMTNKEIELQTARVLIMGIAFKADCKDTRNSKVFDLIEEFKKKCAKIDVLDPLFVSSELALPADINLINTPETNYYDGIVITVAHREFTELNSSVIKSWGKPNSVLFDIGETISKDLLTDNL